MAVREDSALSDPRHGDVHLRRVATASLIGTTIEFYDLFLYGLAASLVFGPEFFPKASPITGSLVSLATFGVGFIARPFGGVLFGHFGDRLGRKRALVVTLMLAGASTFLTGLLPTYDQIGVVAPVLLVLLRLVQGVAIGGEWGGAVLLAMEHAPRARRALYGSFAQMGNPVGLVAAIVVLGLCNGLLSEPAFIAWGWRIPFLLSVVLVAVGLVVRLRLLESPEFVQVKATRQIVRVPVASVLRRRPRALVFGTLAATASPAIGLLVNVYLVSVGQQVLHLSAARMLTLAGASATGFLVAIWCSANLTDRVGRRRLSLIGLGSMAVLAVPFFVVFQTRSVPAMFVAFVVFGATVGVVNGPQAAILADLFPAQLRYSGASLTYQLSAVLGGAVAPLAAVALFASTHSLLSLGFWAAAIAIVSLIAICLLPWRPVESSTSG